MNILIYFIDTISRRQFFRSYPKTVKFLERYFDQEEELDSKAF